MMARIEMYSRKPQLLDPLLKGFVQPAAGNRRHDGSSCNASCIASRIASKPWVLLDGVLLEGVLKERLE